MGREAGRHDLPQTKSPPTRNRQRPSFASSTSNPTDLFQYRIPRMTSVTVMSQSRCHSAYPERNHHDRHSKCSCRASNRDSTWTSIARRRALIAGATGNIVEWFDFTIYGFTAAVLATVFFPPEFGSGALLATFALYGVAFLARPAGGIFFGRLGDRLGRRRSLSLAITLMGCSTAAIGLLPTYASIGVAAPLLLLLCRLVQGFSAGGEYTGAATFVVEHAPSHRRGLYAGIISSSSFVGSILATVTVLSFSLVGTESFADGGWRWPFIIGGVVAWWDCS